MSRSWSSGAPVSRREADEADRNRYPCAHCVRKYNNTQIRGIQGEEDDGPNGVEDVNVLYPFMDCVSHPEIRGGSCGNCVFWEEQAGDRCTYSDVLSSRLLGMPMIQDEWFCGGGGGPDECPERKQWPELATRANIFGPPERRHWKKLSAAQKQCYDDCWIRDEEDDDENSEVDEDGNPKALLARTEPLKFRYSSPPDGVVFDPKARRGFSGVRRSRGPMSNATHDAFEPERLKDAAKKGKDSQWLEVDSEESVSDSNSGTCVE